MSRIISDDFGWLFKRNHQEHDFGIDGQIEIVARDGSVTGQMIAVQIKFGKSFFRERNKWGYIYRGELKHFNYLANYPVPVIICICEPKSRRCYWARFQSDQTQTKPSGWKMTIPFDNLLSSSQEALEALVPAVYDSLKELESYWALNNLLVESGAIFFGLDDGDVTTTNVSRPREFFDRLRSTRELAYECQGKVEIYFFGYDDDLRELYEIDEVREYVKVLTRTLPELLFFVRTKQPTCTLFVFALCHTNVSWPDGRSTETVTRQVHFDTDKVAKFFDGLWQGLNEMTDWLGMSEDENKRITFEAVRCVGFNAPLQ